MPIRPIDIMTMAPKTQDVVKYKHSENQKPIQEQNYLNQTFQNNVKHNSKKPVAMTENDSPNFTYDAKEKGNNEYFDQRKKKNENQQKQIKNKAERKGGIDIRI